MQIFEWTLILLAAAVALAALARRWRLPYPALLAMLGAGLAFLPGAPHFVLEPQLALALFVAPILLDAAFDSSARDLRHNWVSITSLVLVAVGVTTLAVAWAAKALVPELPWAAAIALGAIVAPPDAAAATAVLRETRPPHRILQILEGESLFNDASALLVYRFAVGAAMGEDLSATGAVPVLLATLVGSVAFGLACAWVMPQIVRRIEDIPTSTVVQFVGTFSVWIAAERLHLSGILTIVVFAIAIARRANLPARIRVPSYAVWSTVVFVLNVLAFVLIGLQVGPILERLQPDERLHYAKVALAVLAVVIVVRLAWTMLNNIAMRWKYRRYAPDVKDPPTRRGGAIIGWCGMRGIVTLAAALALPDTFPGRQLILVTAFVVVLGTLVIQGLTLRFVLQWFDLHDDMPVEREVAQARRDVLDAMLASFEKEQSPAADALRLELRETWAADALPTDHAGAGRTPTLRRSAVTAGRAALDQLIARDVIGDDAYHRVELDLDRAELYAETGESIGQDAAFALPHRP